MFDIEVNADIETGWVELRENSVIFLRYSIEYYRSFVLRTVESKDECCPVDAHIREIYFTRFFGPCRRENRP